MCEFVGQAMTHPSLEQRKAVAERLRIKARMIELGEAIQFGSDSMVMEEAADLLDRLPDGELVQGEAMATLTPWEGRLTDKMILGHASKFFRVVKPDESNLVHFTRSIWHAAIDYNIKSESPTAGEAIEALTCRAKAAQLVDELKWLRGLRRLITRLANAAPPSLSPAVFTDPTPPLVEADRETIARIINRHAVDTVKMHGRQNASRRAVYDNDKAYAKADAILAARPTVSESQPVERELQELREWKNAILEKCKYSDGWNDLHWAGDKEGWGFVHYFIGHLNTRALAASPQQSNNCPEETQAVGATK